MKWNLRSKIMIAPLIGAVLFSANWMWSFETKRQTDLSLKDLKENRVLCIESSNHNLELIHKIDEDINNAVTMGDDSLRANTSKYDKEIVGNFNAIIKQCEGPSQKLAQSSLDKYRSWSAAINELADLFLIKKDMSMASQKAKPKEEKKNQLDQVMEKLIKQTKSDVTTLSENILLQQQRGLWVGMAFLGLFLSLTLFLAFKLSNQMKQALMGVIQSMDGMRKNNTFQQLEKQTQDEIGDLVESINALTLNNEQKVEQIKRTVQSLFVCSKDLQSHLNESHQLNDEQVSQMETLKNIAKNLNTKANGMHDAAYDNMLRAEKQCEKAMEYAKEASNASKKASTWTSEAQQSQNEVLELKEKVEMMEGVVKSIGDIAKQTQLLALNAAIEAARAGESGRGFAVVATEVGTLASSSEASSKEIAKVAKELRVALDKVAQAVGEGAQGTQEMADILGRSSKQWSETLKITQDQKQQSEHADELALEQTQESEKVAQASFEIEEKTRSLNKTMNLSMNVAKEVHELAEKILKA